MEQKNRKTLKSYFEKGDVPTEEQFAELIDSVPNIVDDGQVIRTKNSWAFYPPQDGKLDIDLHTAVGEPVVWKFSVTPEKDLLFKNGKEETVLCLTQNKNVTLYGSLHIEGGETPTPSREDYLVFPADKQWYDLPVDISREGFGCRVYSIHASFRERGAGLCRLTRATAIWLNYMEQRIESPEKHWWGWSGNIRLRWLLQEKKLHLQIRTNKRLPSGELHCRIVEMYKG